MKEIEAIRIIKECTMLSCEYHIKNKCNKNYSERDNDFECAKDMAIKALEKQIPKKPMPRKGFAGKCVSCGVVFLDESTAYCGNCGQALDWSENQKE